MSKLEEMQAKLAALLTTMQNHIDNDELDEADNVKKELDKLTDKIEKQKLVDKLSQQIKPPEAAPNAAPADKTKENASYIRACLKKFSKKPLTEIEDALLIPADLKSGGEHGETYILPEDISTKIERLKRQYKSLRDVCGKRTTTALSGSFPIESLEDVTGLVDFTDGTDMEESDDASFKKVSYSIHEYGKLIKLSNTLLALTDNDLINYIVELFAKSACITENKKAIAAITKDKMTKTLPDWLALNTSINVDLDPAALYGTVIVTNQDGFNFLDTAFDEVGRPLLQSDPTQPTKKLFKGYPIHVYSNALLPSTSATASKDGYAPIYYGNLSTGVKFVDLNLKSFATSSEAGFKANVTYARLIEYFDVIQNDGSDKCYCVGQLKIADKTGG